MKVRNTCVLFWAASVILTVTTTFGSPVVREGKPSCDSYKLYYDHGTDNCEECREICVHREIMGTVEQCENNCQKYLRFLLCEEKKPDEYYDENVYACSPCSHICDMHLVTKTTDTCQDKCSAYLAKMTPEQVPSMHKANSLKAMHDGDDSSSSDGFGNSSGLELHPGWIAAISMGSLAILVSVAVGVILYKVCKNQYVPAPTQEVPPRARGQHPVEEEARVHEGSSSSLVTGVATAPLLSNGYPPQAQPTTGFSDLDNDSRRIIVNPSA